MLARPVSLCYTADIAESSFRQDATLVRRRKRWTYTTVLCVSGLLINYLLAHLATGLKLPLYLDNIGSALAAALGGYIPGIIVGFFTNVINGIGDLNTIYYGSLTVLIAIGLSWFKPVLDASSSIGEELLNSQFYPVMEK